MKIYRIAIIGLGGMGNNHALAVQAENNCQLVGGAEIDIARARSWKERFGVNAVFDRYEKMLEQLEQQLCIYTSVVYLKYIQFTEIYIIKTKHISVCHQNGYETNCQK